MSAATSGEQREGAAPNSDSSYSGKRSGKDLQAALPVCRAAQRLDGVVRFTKRPVTIEAVRINAADYNGRDFDGSPFDAGPQWLIDACEAGVVSIHRSNTDYAMWQIKTLEDGPNGEAKHIAGPGDWIVRGVQGELYFCKGEIFEQTYEPALSLATKESE